MLIRGSLFWERVSVRIRLLGLFRERREEREIERGWRMHYLWNAMEKKRVRLFYGTQTKWQRIQVLWGSFERK